MPEKAILFDVTKCMACRGCQVACKQWNDLKGVETTNRGTYENPADLSVDTWMKIRFMEESNNGSISWLFSRQACMHCNDAGCVNACPTQALYHHELGFVSYNKDRCSGCGYCAEFCPYDVPHLDTNQITGFGKMDKCTFCQDRVTNGLDPACVATCPTGALQFGDRGELLMQGWSRARTLQGQGYSDATVYGENQLGGLHVLYVLDRGPGTYGLPADPQLPLAQTALRDIMRPIGYGLVGAVTVGLGVNYLVARARMVREKEGR